MVPSSLRLPGQIEFALSGHVRYSTARELKASRKGDKEKNVAALCCDCHLEGVHAGRLAVQPPASRTL
jgi:hypothetical protein